MRFTSNFCFSKMFSTFFFLRALLTLYHTIPTFNDPEEEALENTFPTIFSTLLKTEIIILAMFDLSSTSALNLDDPKILSFGKELNRVGSFSYQNELKAVKSSLLRVVFKVWLVGCMVCYVAFNSISFISQRELILFLAFLGFT